MHIVQNQIAIAENQNQRNGHSQHKPKALSHLVSNKVALIRTIQIRNGWRNRIEQAEYKQKKRKINRVTYRNGGNVVIAD